MKKRYFFLIALAGGLLWLDRVARRSGVQPEDLTRSLPGDDLLPDATFVMDRAATFDAPARAVWPWIAQLGKERGGWYVPRWLEQFTHGTLLSGIRHIDPRFQQAAVGDLVPEYGPGQPWFKVIQAEPPHMLVYLSLRDPAARWGWPSPEQALPQGTFAFSWAFVLDDIGEDHSRVLLRFRALRAGKPIPRVFHLLGGLIDYLTIVLMFAGLRERLRTSGF